MGITKEYALQFEPGALKNDIEKRKKNIEVFKKAIENELSEIQNNTIMIAIIEAEHAGPK